MADTTLPPLPSSDAESMQRNRYHGFYDVGSRDYWQDAQVTSHTVEDFKKCMHFFEKQSDEIRCKKCHIGWQVPNANVEVRNGQLYMNNFHMQL